MTLLQFRSPTPLETKRRYVFDPDKLHQIAAPGVGLPHAEMCSTVIDGLKRARIRDASTTHPTGSSAARAERSAS